MIETVRVLVVDDEQPVREALKLWFEASKAFRFDVVCVDSPERCVALEDGPGGRFHVCVIDLQFGGDETQDHVGQRMVLGLSCVRDGGIAVVYSGHPAVPNVVRAMQLGATDFVSKAECPPHKFVEHVEKLLNERQRRKGEWHRIAQFLRDQRDQLSRQYPGRVVAIVTDESQTQVVADGRSRMDALLRYAERRKNGDHLQWPAYPHLHIVPSPEPE